MGALLVTGASGLVGAATCSRMAMQGHTVHAGFGSQRANVPDAILNIQPFPCDLSDPASLERIVQSLQPSVVVHLGAMSSLAACEADPARAERINVVSTQAIARACSAIGSAMIFASTDQVYDGEHAPFVETDPANPLHIYGQSKLQAEEHVAALGKRGLSLRLCLVFGNSPTGTRSASEQILHAVARGDSLRLFTDEWRTPILVDDVANVISELADRMQAGDALLPAEAPRILNLGGPDRVSRYEFGERIIEAFHRPGATLTAASRDDMASTVRRPRDVSLDSSLAHRILTTTIRSLRDGLADIASQQDGVTHHAPRKGQAHG